MAQRGTAFPTRPVAQLLGSNGRFSVVYDGGFVPTVFLAVTGDAELGVSPFSAMVPWQ